MKKPVYFVLLPTLGWLLSCQKQSDPQSLVWTKDKGSPPALFSSEQFATPDRPVWVLGEIVKISEQKWGPAVVESGFLKIVESANGDAKFGRADFIGSPVEVIPLDIRKLEDLHANRYLFVERLKVKFSWLRLQNILSEPRLVIVFENKKPYPAYVLDIENPKASRVERFWFSPSMAIIKKQIVSSEFQAEAWVFPLDNQQTLQETLLRDLLKSPSLESIRHIVSSQAPEKISSVAAPWKFELNDSRFDQVQAFYFMQEGLDFFVHELDFTFPIAVQAQTSAGYPEKTNAAFTYGNQIRLGAGDNISYSSMARDPSVVIHELGHVLVNIIARLSSQGEGGSLSEAFADFFAASHLNNPKMGSFSFLQGPYKRNLEDKILFTEKTGGLYHDSQIVSGTLWELRTKIGKDKAQRLALKTLARLTPVAKLEDFATAIRLAQKDLLNAQETFVLEEILRDRRWPE